jgi:predicted nucleotidyltransferase
MAKFKNTGLEIALRYIKNLIEAGITIKKAYLYGSYAKEAATKDSDIDIAVISPDFSGDRFNDAIFLKKFRINIDLRIEPLPLKPEDFVEGNPIVSEILSYAIPITVHAKRRSYKLNKLRK